VRRSFEIMGNIKVTYIVDNDTMTDDEYENQQNKEFIITEQMIYDFITQNDTKIQLYDTIEILDINLTN